MWGGSAYMAMMRRLATLPELARWRVCVLPEFSMIGESNQINGYTSINLTKLDVLDNLAEIKVGIIISMRVPKSRSSLLISNVWKNSRLTTSC